VHDAGAGVGRRARDVAGAVGVDAGGQRLVRLGVVHARVGGAVDDGVGREARDDALGGGRVGDVDVGHVDARGVVAADRASPDDAPAEHAGRAP
jgi:hypothetical protein